MASLKRLIRCVGLSGRISVHDDFYGYWTRSKRKLSLARQAALLAGKHVHMNVILVGVEDFNDLDARATDNALHTARTVYGAVGLGIGRIARFQISKAQAHGLNVINSDDQATDLANDWTVPNDGLDIFLVRNAWGNTVGVSDAPGPCDKNDTYDAADAKFYMTGSVVDIESQISTLAHEAGHYLGLQHVDPKDPKNANNLMLPAAPSNPVLTSSQGQTMRKHCFAKRGCVAT